MADSDQIPEHISENKTEEQKTDNAAHPKPKIDKPPSPRLRSVWGFSYVKRKLHERRARREAQPPEQQAAHSTAVATWWIAIFTVILAFVGILTLYEVISGGSDTHDLAVAAKIQAEKIKGIADAAEKMRIASERMASASEANERALEASNRNNLSATAVQQRPYLVVSELDFVTPDAPGSAAFQYVNVRFRNTGLTPAFSAEPYAKLTLVGPFTKKTQLDSLVQPIFDDVRKPYNSANGQDVPPNPALGTITSTTGS